MTDRSHFDSVVLGAGLAGITAALRLKQLGKNVAIVAKSMGATSISSGAFDIGPIPLGRDYSLQDCLNSADWAKKYSELLWTIPLSEMVQQFQEAMTDLSGRLKAVMPLHVSTERALILPLSRGGWKATFAAHAIQAKADLAGLKGKRVGVLSCESFRFLSESLIRQWQGGQPSRFKDIDWEPLWTLIPGLGSDVPLPQFASRLFHDASLQNQVLEAIKRSLAGRHIDFVLFPPMFVDSNLLTQWSKSVGIPMGECLSSRESVAGFRFIQALRQILEKERIPLFMGEQSEIRNVPDQVHAINLLNPVTRQWKAIEADQFVLATGKLFGGGVHLGYQNVTESAFHLPLYISKSSGTIQFRSQLDWNPRDFAEEQDWAKLGVKLNRDLRPVDASDSVVFKNLFACGSIIGGLDFARQGLGLGFMASSGRICANEVAKARS